MERESVFFVPTLHGYSVKQTYEGFKQLRQSDRNYLFREDFLKFSDYLFALGHVRRIFEFKIPYVLFHGVDLSSLIWEELRSMRGISSAILGLLNFRFFLIIQKFRLSDYPQLYHEA